MLGLLVLGGAFVGLLSGLLGVGGAVIIMPLLNVFFDRLGFSVDTTQHLSLGTSLATILFTSLSSVLAHRRYGSVRADIWKRWPPASLRARSAARFSLHTFQDYSCAAFHLLRHAGRRSSALQFHPPPQDRAARTGHASGQHTHRPDFEPCGHRRDHALCDFPGLGRDRLADAVGTSAALSLPISLTGTLGYAIAGWNVPELPPYSVGFVYLPGMFCLLVSSMSMAVVGARLAHSPRLPMQVLRRCFAVGNILLGLSILRSVLFR